MAWNCGGGCSSRYIWMTMPRKRLTSGIRRGRAGSQVQVFGFSTGHLQPKRVWAEIELVVPAKLAERTDPRAAEEIVIFPRRVNAGMWFVREVHFPLHAVVEAQPDAVDRKSTRLNS